MNEVHEVQGNGNYALLLLNKIIFNHHFHGNSFIFNTGKSTSSTRIVRNSYGRYSSIEIEECDSVLVVRTIWSNLFRTSSRFDAPCKTKKNLSFSSKNTVSKFEKNQLAENFNTPG
jgi:hypothetical protein